MKIYYPGFEGAYSHLASLDVQKNLTQKINEIIGVNSFEKVWEMIGKGNIGVLPIENSYAGSVHQNFYNFLRYDFKIIGEIITPIDHCLASNIKNLKQIKTIYSHPQAIAQCYSFLKKHNIESTPFQDTAGAAKMISELKNNTSNGAICSEFAAKLYGLNIIKEKIQDQKGNSTRFIVVSKKSSKLKYKNIKNKTTIVFETKNIPAALYKCLGGFATNGINLTKIESLPSLKGNFTYLFWLEFEGNIKQELIKKSLDELKFFTNELKILGSY